MIKTYINIFLLLCLFLFCGSAIVHAQHTTGLIQPSVQQAKNLRQAQMNFAGASGLMALRTQGTKALATAATRSSYDLREEGFNPAVRDQGECGACWAFSAVCSYESSYALRNGTLLDLSEQQAMNCATNGSCFGGFPMEIFYQMVSEGNRLIPETVVPYAPPKGNCGSTSAVSYGAVTYGAVDQRIFSAQASKPTVQELKEAIAAHGAVSCGITATPAFILYSGGGVFAHEPFAGEVNHAVNLMGWDDSKGAWLVRNTWGSAWGDNGYAWVAYDANGIGTLASWIDAEIIPQPEPINDLAPTQGEAVLAITSDLKSLQDYQEIHLVIDGRVFFWSSAQKKTEGTQTTRRVPISLGEHPYRLLVKTRVDDGKQRKLIVGYGTGTIRAKTARISDMKLKWSRVKDSDSSDQLLKVALVKA